MDRREYEARRCDLAVLFAEDLRRQHRDWTWNRITREAYRFADVALGARMPP